MSFEMLDKAGTDPSCMYDGLSCRTSGALLEDEFLKNGKGMKFFPWIKINHIYANITAETGGWMALIARLYCQGYRKFRVLSGRHGDVYNYDNNLFGGGFYGEDRQRKINMENGTSTFGNGSTQVNYITVPETISIDVVDMATYSFGQQTQGIKLQSKIAKARGEVLILSWCFSLYAFNSLTINKVVELQQHEYQHQNEPLYKGISGFGVASMTAIGAVKVRENAKWTVKRHHEFCYPVRNVIMNDWMWAYQ
ncbi:hypothetical protein [Marinibactrum halimedae]|uniref:Uncharacterized protein n=1 Tax=Marinibactrum halimedae TaxID=1444977 RepID=A0AA37T0U1_9GAMM|nr:hypothetical protein [Marinibactrum halimedae]MCD9460990.1 hypothetical protein [Marinibactrum halimedae]GLS24780.1 hypothetical protein GCM10007877_04940 [Marinibactrum halimedae]